MPAQNIHENLLEKLLDEVDVGHDHATAAVALEAELIQSITNHRLSVIVDCISKVVRRCRIPVGDLLAIDQLQVSLPEIAHHLCAKVSNLVGRVNGGGSGARRVAYLAARKAPDWNNHFVGESND